MENRGLGIHVELTSNCQSRCLDCGRFIAGSDTINPHVDIGSKGNISMDAIANIFDNDTSANVRYVNFTGTYGEATMHHQFFEILHFIADKVETQKDHRVAKGLAPTVCFMIETNGGLHDPDYWKQLATIVKERFHPSSRFIFGIDGIDDKTHQMYRRGVNLNQLFSNALAVIAVGVNAEWSMIKFTHNEHQFATAALMATELGFTKFSTRRSRLRNVLPGESRPIRNIDQKKKSISKVPVYMDKADENPSPPRKKDFYWDKPVPDYINETEVICEWKKKNNISIDYTGRVWQCCYFSTFYHSPVEWWQKDLIDKLDVNAIVQRFENLEYYETKYNDGWNNVNLIPLSEILAHQFFITDLPASVNNKTDDDVNPRIFRCGKFCGGNSRKIDKEQHD